MPLIPVGMYANNKELPLLSVLDRLLNGPPGIMQVLAPRPLCHTRCFYPSGVLLRAVQVITSGSRLIAWSIHLNRLRMMMVSALLAVGEKPMIGDQPKIFAASSMVLAMEIEQFVFVCLGHFPAF